MSYRDGELFPEILKEGLTVLVSVRIHALKGV